MQNWRSTAMPGRMVARTEIGKRRRLRLSVQYAVNPDGVPLKAQVRRWVRAAYGGAGQVTVRFVAEEEGRSLNRDYRVKDYPTNVLSFSYSPDPSLSGDIVVCVPVAIDEATRLGKPPEAHFAHLIVHGMLHLQGFDHDLDAQAAVMEARERAILAALGYCDPYKGEYRE